MSDLFPTVESRPHPVYKWRTAHWATVADSGGRYVAQRGPFRSKQDAMRDAGKLLAERQASLPGTAPDVAGMLQRKADAPIKPPAPQQPCDVGLFSGARNQLDMF